LTQVLRHLPVVEDPRVLVDAVSRDDAAVFRISDDRALVATTDFFTPIVDDPVAWGAIACANALSDVYAMGGTPLFALNLVGWPREALPFSMLGEVMDGAAAVAREAGCLLLGGHSVDDPEPKYGLAVIGEVHPDRMMTTTAGRPGDELILTKPLGTGILTTALKQGRVGEAELAEATAVMRALNAGAARVAMAHGVRAATDVTGFGLLGHLGNILDQSNLAAEIGYENLPVMAKVVALAAEGVVPAGSQRNLLAADRVQWESIDEAERLVCADAQTSGGLLLAVPPEAVNGVMAGLTEAGTAAAARIGRLVDGPTGAVDVRRRYPFSQ
jgi:selenide,water dikinase